jgi:diguanylate cyclase (GGDEF)-like protein/PAS domain S-box-containing protein
MKEEQDVTRKQNVIRVLLVGDNETDSVLARALLQEVDPGRFDVHWASSYNEGLASLCGGNYDVCLMDLRLGTHSDLDIFLEENQGGCSTPTILLTSFDTREVDEQALHARAADYLVKDDLSGRELVRAIDYAIERSRAAQSLKQSRQFLQSTLDSLPAHIAVLDEHGVIVAVNHAWRQYAQQNGCIGAECDIGVDYLQVCEATTGPEAHQAHLVSDGIRSVVSGEKSEFCLEHLWPSSDQLRWFAVMATRFKWEGPTHVLVAHEDVTQRHETEAAMRASEARFRASAEGSLDSFYILEGIRSADGSLRDLRIVYSNARGAALFGRPVSDVLGRELRTLIPAQHIQGFVESCDEVIKTRLTAEGTNRVNIPAIHIEWLHFQIVPLDDGVAVTIKDISEEKRALKALQKREQQLSEAQEIAHVGSWDVDSKTRAPRWSDESYRIYGLEPQSEELTVDRVFEFIHPDDRETVRNITRNAAKNVLPFRLQHRLIRPDGEQRIVESQAQTFSDEQGTFVRMVGTMHDVTDQVHYERALRESQELLQAVVTSVDMVIWSLDRSGIVTMSEGKGLGTVGLQSGEVVGRNIYDLAPAGSPSAEAARRALAGEDVSVTLEIDGLYWETRYSPLRDQAGQIIGATGVAIDITERLQAEVAVRESNQQILTIWESMADSFYALDHEWRFTYVNSQAERVLQRKREELLGRVLWDEFPETTQSAFFVHYHRAVNEQTAVSFEEFYPPLNTWIEVRAFPSALGLSVYFGDITARKRAEEALRQAEERYRSIFEHAVEGIFQTASDCSYLSVNPALARIYGYDSPEDFLQNRTGTGRQLFVDSQRCTELLQSLNEEGFVREAEAQVYRKDGSVIWTSINARIIRDEAGNPLFYEGSVEDISQRKESEYRLHLEAFYDRLTKLPNRALFTNRLGHVLELSKRRPEYSFAVLFLDFDGFKHINDSLGHVLGDELLIEIGQRLGRGLRPGDTVARLGGDEFTVLLEDIRNTSSAILVAERIHHEMARPLHLAGHEVFPSVSIGIAFGMNNYDKAEDVLRDADTAMYRAKARGRGHYQVFDPSMHAHAVHRPQYGGRVAARH